MKNARRRQRIRQQQRHIFSVEHEGELCGWMRDEPVGPAERAWLEQVVAVAIRFAREVSDDVSSQMIDFIIVGRAAEVLWAASPGAPHWRDLDVDAFLAALEPAGMGVWLPRDNAIASLIAFAHYLARYGHLTEDEALVVISRLDRHAPAEMIALGYKPVVLPPSLLPS